MAVGLLGAAMIAWDKTFLNLCDEIAQRSKDPSTKVGACIVDDKKRIVSMGYNGFPRGCNDAAPFYEDRAVKLMRTIHAEVNAIITAGRAVDGYTLYVSPLHPCANCAAIIVQSGIKRVVYKASNDVPRWADSFQHAAMMFLEAGVSVDCVE